MVESTMITKSEFKLNKQDFFKHKDYTNVTGQDKEDNSEMLAGEIESL